MNKRFFASVMGVVMMPVEDQSVKRQLVELGFSESESSCLLTLSHLDQRIQRSTSQAFEDQSIDYQMLKDALLNSLKSRRLDCLELEPEVLLVLRKALSLFKEDRDFITQLAQKNTAIFLLDPSLRKDRSILLDAVKKDVFLLNDRRNQSFVEDKEFMLEAIKENAYAYYYAGENLRLDPEILEEVVKDFSRKGFDGLRSFLQEAIPKEISEQKELLLLMCSYSSFAFDLASDTLKSDREFLLRAIESNHTVLNRIERGIKSDLSFQEEAIRLAPHSLIYFLPLISERQNTEIAVNISRKVRNKQHRKMVLRANFLHRKELAEKESFTPFELQCVYTCLRSRFPKEIAKNLITHLFRHKKALKNAQKGFFSEIVELLLLQTPPISPSDIRTFFTTLDGLSADQIMQQSKLIRLFLKISSVEKRRELSAILNRPFEEKIEQLQQVLLEFIKTFGIFDSEKQIRSVFSTKRGMELMTYLQKHQNDFELKPSISRLLHSIFQNRFFEERYSENSSEHIQELASYHLDIWNHWKSLSFSKKIQAQSVLKEEPSFSFKNFLRDKLQHRHLPQEFESALTGEIETEFKAQEGFERCFRYLKECVSLEGALSQQKIEEGLVLFRRYYGERNEFINDLTSLLPQKQLATSIEISASWEDLLACGTDVAGSCQRIDGDPSFNKCLLAYLLDGKNQLLCVKDSEGKIVGRTILRLLFKQLEESDEPAIFIERYYGEPSYEKILEEEAKEIAKSMGLDLYSLGGEEETLLLSFGSSVPYEYVDAQEDVTEGVFSISSTNCLTS